MKPDVPPALTRAQGYFELAMYGDAEAELATLTAAERARPEVTALCLGCLFARKKWPEAAALAGPMTRSHPGDSHWWIQYAYATRRAESIEAAEEILLRATELHAGEPLIWFNLACYAAVTARLPEARERLARAAILEKSFLDLARRDEDLKALWPELKAG